MRSPVAAGANIEAEYTTSSKPSLELMLRFPVTLALAAVLCLSSSAFAAAWPTADGELVISQTSLYDYYDIYARHSANRVLLEDVKGSVVQVGPVRRFGFFLNAEYGLTERVSANLGIAYFLTTHEALGDNTKLYTFANPNQQWGLQDFTGQVKYLLWSTQTPTVMFGIAPFAGWAIPLQKYDTTVNNPIGDGILSLDLGASFSAALPNARLFFNLDALYKVREKKRFQAGDSVSEIKDQIQLTAEAGYFIIPSLSIRLMGRYYESLGGQQLTFAISPEAVEAGVDAMQLYENPLIYDQDALFIGGGPYWQVNDYFGVGVNYVHAVWFRNHANLRTVMLSLSFSPQLSRPKAEPMPEPPAGDDLDDAPAAAE